MVRIKDLDPFKAGLGQLADKRLKPRGSVKIQQTGMGQYRQPSGIADHTDSRFTGDFILVHIGWLIFPQVQIKGLAETVPHTPFPSTVRQYGAGRSAQLQTWPGPLPW